VTPSDGIEQDRRAHAGAQQHEENTQAVDAIDERVSGVPIEQARGEDVAVNDRRHQREHRHKGENAGQKREPAFRRSRQDSGEDNLQQAADE
jgi:hypothetical protein